MKRDGFEKISFNYKGKEIILEVKRCGFFGRFRGLMFRNLKDSRALLFDFERLVRFSIHSLFVRFPFVVIWLDENGKVVRIKKVDKNIFDLRPDKKFVKLIEIPVKEEYSSILKLLDGD